MLTLYTCLVKGERHTNYPFIIYSPDNNYIVAVDLSSPNYNTLEKCVAKMVNGNCTFNGTSNFKGELLATFTDYDDLVNNYPELLI